MRRGSRSNLDGKQNNELDRACQIGLMKIQALATPDCRHARRVLRSSYGMQPPFYVVNILRLSARARARCRAEQSPFTGSFLKSHGATVPISWAMRSERDITSTAETIQEQERQLQELTSFLSKAAPNPPAEETDWIREALRAARARGASDSERNGLMLEWLEQLKEAHDTGLPTERGRTAARIREQERQLQGFTIYLSNAKVRPPLEEFELVREACRAAKARGDSAVECNQIMLAWLERQKKGHEADLSDG